MPAQVLCIKQEMSMEQGGGGEHGGLVMWAN